MPAPGRRPRPQPRPRRVVLRQVGVLAEEHRPAGPERLHLPLAAACAGRDGGCAVKDIAHPPWDPFLYVLDARLPVIDIGHDKAWDPTGADEAVMIGLMVCGWALATTIIGAAGRALHRS
ncbi:MAG: hypothetical protein ABW000_16180 [Actinoplanes sp.]